MDTQNSMMEAQNKESLRSQQVEDETNTDTPIYVVHLTVQKSEDVKIIKRGMLRELEDIKSEIFTEEEHSTRELSQAVDVERGGLITGIIVKQEQLEVEIDIENNGNPDVEHINIEREELDIKIEEFTNGEAIKEELFEEVKQEKSKPTGHNKIMEFKGRSRDQYVPEIWKTVKETEPPKTNTGTDVSASAETAAVMMEVSKNTSRCSDTATHRGNVSVDSDNEYTTVGTDVGDSRGEHLTNKNMFDDKRLLIRHVEHHDNGKRKGYQTSCDKSAQEYQRFDKTAVLNKHTETYAGRFKCDICHRIFTQSSALNTHLKIHTKEKPFECVICERRFTVKSSLNKHLRIHTKEKPFECAICKLRFAEKWIVNAHLRTHTNEKPFECAICQRRFTGKSNLNKHLRTHSEEKPFECAICERRFTEKINLNKHLKMHTKEKPFECVICQRRFSEKGNLNTHLRMHTKEKPYECAICQRRFALKSSLNKHVRIHTKEKPFECSMCERRFSQKVNLNTHIRIHTKEKPFECVICQLRFTRKSNLKRHLRMHTKEKPFECAICQRRFAVKSSLDKHLRIHAKH